VTNSAAIAIEGSRVPRQRRARVNAALVTGAVIIVTWALAAVGAPVLAPHSPTQIDVMRRLEPPGPAHLLGTDETGRDNLSRLLYGARITLPTAVIVVFLAATVGTAVGALAGYAGGRVDDVLMRIADVVLAFPSILLAMAITAALGSGLDNAILAIVLVSWPEFSRLMRAQVLAIRHNEYVVAASAAGATNSRILRRHVLLNAFPPVLVKATLDVGHAVIFIAGLSFLGLGAVPPAPEWGAMIAAGQTQFEYWWVATFPGLAILSVVLGFNFLGDGLQDALDPRRQGSGRVVAVR
jgi:peptide/nickel transport system permease protein